MKLLNLIILNFNFLTSIKSNIPKIDQSLLELESNSKSIHDASDSFILKNFKNDNSNSIQSYHPNQLSNDPPHSSSILDFDLNLTYRISSTGSQTSSNLKYPQFIRAINGPFQTDPKRKIPPSDIDPKSEIKRRREKSKSNREKIKLYKYHSGSSNELPFSQHNFHQNWKIFEPKDIGGIIAMESIHTLQRYDGLPFFHLPQFRDNSQDLSRLSNKIFRLDISNVKSSKALFDFFWIERSGHFTPTEKAGCGNALERKKLTWEILVDSSDEPESIKKKFLDYKRIALLDFNEEIRKLNQLATQRFMKIRDERDEELRLDKELGRKHDKIRNEEKKHQTLIASGLKQFTRAAQPFPLFLLYVDLINTILPAENFDKAGNDLGAQRKIAGEGYLQRAKYLVGLKYDIEDLKQLPTVKIDMFPSVGDKPLFPLSHDKGTEFVWKNLHEWILTSRQEISKIAIHEQTICSQFRFFFAQLIESWCLSPS